MGGRAREKMIRVSQELDLALIQAEGLQGVPLPLGDAGALQVGDPVVVVGAPKGMEFSVTQGGISNLDRVSLGVAYVQTDAAINPGNSRPGPMLDQEGRVVGVVSMKRRDAEGIALARADQLCVHRPRIRYSASSLTEGSPGFERMLAAAATRDKQEVASLATHGTDAWPHRCGDRGARTSRLPSSGLRRSLPVRADISFCAVAQAEPTLLDRRRACNLGKARRRGRPITAAAPREAVARTARLLQQHVRCGDPCSTPRNAP